MINRHTLIHTGAIALVMALAYSPSVPARAGEPNRPAIAQVSKPSNNRLIEADFMMWYQPDLFDGTKTFDVPASGGYNSDDINTIRRQVALAQQACLNGFTAHWFGAKEPRTTANFSKLLAVSRGTGLKHAVVLLENSLRGTTEKDLIASVNYVLANWANHPNYLKIDGKPVIFFEGMMRPWGGVSAAKSGWAHVRQATDPNRKMIWFAEGLGPTFNPLFDGLYVYRIDHQTAPRSWLKQPVFASQLRAVEQQSGIKQYFADTIAPGFDDTRSVKVRATDVRTPAPAFARDRGAGAYYRDTFSVTAQTGGDLMLVKSFNEWVEGTAIEPGSKYGDLYLKLTCEMANAYRTADKNPVPQPTLPSPASVKAIAKVAVTTTVKISATLTATIKG